MRVKLPLKRSLAVVAAGTSIAVLSIALLGVGQAPTYHADTRLVEVYATVQDHPGHYVDGLTEKDFQVADDGQAQKIKYFENNADSVSCALLIDTTGSMDKVLPHLKNSVVSLIGDFGEKDSVAVYNFSDHLTVAQSFTTDKAAAKRAALQLRAGGKTALFDALSQASTEAAKQAGKKALIVFTDGDDNASVLNAAAAISRARKNGMPVFTIAEGDATQSPKLEKLLADLSKSTGGSAYEVKTVKDIDTIFGKITHELQHMYLLGYAPAFATADGKWHTIEVTVPGVSGAKVRAKEGYQPEQ